jgi:glycosyltransferase involved in cell wall biosynthesis
MKTPLLSVVVIAYNMAREAPRTIRTLSPLMQHGLQADDYEIILVDNGSAMPLDRDAYSGWGANIRFHQMSATSASPAAAVNVGINLAKGELIGVMVDGARMASPGLLASAVIAQRLHRRPIISALAFHLGPTVQTQSIHQGYNQAAEDQLLQSMNWECDGYRLFEISAFAESQGWFRPISESTALFMPRTMWRELAGFDERFVCPGGGLVNLDAFRRACDLSESQLIVLLGEGTFHQFHHGIATNALLSPWTQFHDEYISIRQQPYAFPANEAWLFGKPSRAALPFIISSAQNTIGG